MNYEIIHNETMLDNFIQILPELKEKEVFYVCLFGRHKYDPNFPNSKDSGQLSRFVSSKEDLKEKLRRLECPVGSFTRDGIVVSQESLAVYIGLNPRSLPKANKNLFITMAQRIADGDFDFNPISVATTEIHRATSRKIYIDFDYDDANPSDYISSINQFVPIDSYHIIQTRGGFHLIVELEKVKNSNWHKGLASLPKCDVRGTNNLTPIPGCVQGGFSPILI